MAYRIRVADTAKKDLQEASEWIEENRPSQHTDWYNGLTDAIFSLEEMPRRCSPAQEQRKFGGELRQLLYGSGGLAYRILFTILPAVEAEEDGLVRVLRIWHTARKRPTAKELEQGMKD